MIKESDLERKLTKKIEKIGGLSIKFWPFSLSGFPDRIILLPFGRIFFVEMKQPNGKFEGLQKWWKKKLEKLGFKVFVIWDDNDINNFIQHVTIF